MTLRNADINNLKDHYDRLVGKLEARGISHHDAEDAAADALCKKLAAISVRDTENWLPKVAMNCARTLIRKRGIAAKHQQALWRQVACVREQAIPEPVTEVVHREEEEMFTRIVTEGMATLAALDREILLKSFDTDLTDKELAERFNLTYAAFKGRVRRAKERLRRYLEPRLFGPKSGDLT